MKSRILLFLIGIFIILIFEALQLDYPGGFVGVTRRDGGTGCICHGQNPVSGVSVLLLGPDSVAIGEYATYQLKVLHGPAQTGGCDIAAFHGIIDTFYVDLNTLKRDTIRNELTHKFPKGFVGDSVIWTFKYKAPGTVQVDTLYSVGNSTNNDFQADSLDKWNFSENKPIRVYMPIGIKPISGSIPKQFKLYQNYPNPFNPITKIKFDITHGLEGFNTGIVIYDINGRAVTSLVNEQLSSGSYEVTWNASSQPSGVYFVKFLAGNFTDTKKIILVK